MAVAGLVLGYIGIVLTVLFVAGAVALVVVAARMAPAFHIQQVPSPPRSRS